MANCNRDGVRYKRHNFRLGKCKGCGQKQTNIYPKPKRK